MAATVVHVVVIIAEINNHRVLRKQNVSVVCYLINKTSCNKMIMKKTEPSQ